MHTHLSRYTPSILLSSLLLLSTLGACNDELDPYVFTDNFGCRLDTAAEYIVVLGDIQEYTYRAKWANRYYMPTVNWIRSMANLHHYHIDCVLQTGDLTNNNEGWQYGYFEDYTKALAAEQLFITVPGNHDYDWHGEQITDRTTSGVTRYASFHNTTQHIEAQYEVGRIDNAIYRNTIHGHRYDIIALEYGPRPKVLEWANDYVKSHPEHKFILMTHEFLVSDGWRVTNGWSSAEKQFSTIPYSTPEDVWQKLVYDNDNIRCVLCGHNGFSRQFYTPNAAGRDVPQILFNLQYLPHGGDGYLQLWKIPISMDSVEVKVYNSLTNELYSDSIDEKFDYHKAHFKFKL